MSSLENPAPGVLKRKRGGQPGNWNRLVHGDRSKRVIEERRARWRAEWTAQELVSLAWIEAREEACRAQHARIMDEIDRERREREAAGDYRWSRRG